MAAGDTSWPAEGGWPLKTASTFAVRAREARPSGGKVADRPQAAREAESVHPPRWETRDVPVSLHRDETGATAVNRLGELH